MQDTARNELQVIDEVGPCGAWMQNIFFEWKDAAGDLRRQHAQQMQLALYRAAQDALFEAELGPRTREARRLAAFHGPRLQRRLERRVNLLANKGL